jgi:hypothetical protein
MQPKQATDGSNHEGGSTMKWRWSYFDRRELFGFVGGSLDEIDPDEFPFCITKPSPPFAWGEYYGVTRYRWLAILRVFLGNNMISLRRLLHELWSSSAAVVCPECYAGGGREPGACDNCRAKESCRNIVLLP